MQNSCAVNVLSVLQVICIYQHTNITEIANRISVTGTGKSGRNSDESLTTHTFPHIFTKTLINKAKF